MSTDRILRSRRAVRGLAYGDALGAPAGLHRTVRDPWVRHMQHRGAEQLDQAQVLRTVAPFVLTAIGAQTLVATDDTEGFAIMARVLLATPGLEPAEMFDTWRGLLDVPEVWTGPAQRSALLNAGLGLRPPQTGNDNPAFYDDTALPGALACAILGRTPDAAEALARELASITHARVGVEGAALFAWLMASLLDGAALDGAVRSLPARLEQGSWLADGLRDAVSIVDGSPSGFAALPALIERFAPRVYSHPGTVAETLPLALAISLAAGGSLAVALPLSLSVSRHQDSLPALVGAICGVADENGECPDLGPLHGVCVPALAGTALDELSNALSEARTA